MRATVLALACLACAGNARRVAFNPSSPGIHSKAIVNEPVAHRSPTMTDAEYGVSRRATLGAAALIGAALTAPAPANARKEKVKVEWLYEDRGIFDPEKLDLTESLRGRLTNIKSSVDKNGKASEKTVKKYLATYLKPYEGMLYKMSKNHGKLKDESKTLAAEYGKHMKELELALNTNAWEPYTSNGKEYKSGKIQAEIDEMSKASEAWWKLLFEVQWKPMMGQRR